MIRYLGKKLVYFIMTGPLFHTSETEEIQEEKIVRRFLWWGLSEMKRIFFRREKTDESDE